MHLALRAVGGDLDDFLKRTKTRKEAAQVLEELVRVEHQERTQKALSGAKRAANSEVLSR